MATEARPAHLTLTPVSALIHTCTLQEGSITGTEADLRKLGHEEAGRMLMQWGVKKEVVDSMTNRCAGAGGAPLLSTYTFRHSTISGQPTPSGGPFTHTHSLS